MKRRLALCLLLAVGCSSTEPDQNLTGSWTGTFATTSPAGPSTDWSASLTQTGNAVSGSLDCASTETYTVTGTNVHNSARLTLVGAFGDTASFSGTASNHQGVQVSGTFFDNAGAACLSGVGVWQGRLQ